MKKILLLLFLLTFIFTGCGKDSISDDSASSENSGEYASSSSGGGGGSGNDQEEEDYSGKITAGEWNDLQEWEYWNDLKNNQEFIEELTHWEFYFDNRISVAIKNMANLPVIDAEVAIKANDGSVIWESKTDNKRKNRVLGEPFYAIGQPRS